MTERTNQMDPPDMRVNWLTWMKDLKSSNFVPRPCIVNSVWWRRSLRSIPCVKHLLHEYKTEERTYSLPKHRLNRKTNKHFRAYRHLASFDVSFRVRRRSREIGGKMEQLVTPVESFSKSGKRPKYLRSIHRTFERCLRHILNCCLHHRLRRKDWKIHSIYTNVTFAWESPHLKWLIANATSPSSMPCDTISMDRDLLFVQEDPSLIGNTAPSYGTRMQMQIISVLSA